VTKPGSESAIVMLIAGLTLAGCVLGYGIGHQIGAKHRDPAASTLPLALPPSTVIHPPMICRNGGCAELKAGPP
jgi:hypothetical protein